MRLGRVLPIVLVSAVALTASACLGGGGGGSSTEGPDSSKIATATLPAQLPPVRILGESIVSTGGRRTYTIRAGDTLSAVADRFGVTLDELLTANPDIDPTGLVAGDTINLPETVAGSPAASSPTPSGSAVTDTPEPTEEEPTAVEELPTDTPEPVATNTPVTAPPVGTPTAQSLGTTYIVQEGDTFAIIAVRFGVSIESLAEANPTADSSQLQIGQVLFIPPAG